MLPAPVAAALKRHDLLAHTDVVARSLQPAVHIVAGKPSKRPLPVGRSRLGGEPDLPAREPWPTVRGHPMHFLAQIRLSDLPPGHIPRNLLPSRGWLRFWYDTIGERMVEQEHAATGRVDGNKLEGIHDPASYRITFDPGETRTLTRRPFPGVSNLPPDYGHPWWQAFPECAASLAPAWSLPQQVMNAIVDAEEARDRKGWERAYAFIEAIHDQSRVDGNHRLLGDVFEVQTDFRFTCECHARGFPTWTIPRDSPEASRLNRTKDTWRLLAILDSDRHGTDWCWGDAGSLLWFIKPADLARRRFNKACGIWDNGG